MQQMQDSADIGAEEGKSPNCLYPETEWMRKATADSARRPVPGVVGQFDFRSSRPTISSTVQT